MSDHEQQQPVPRRGKVLEALARAERKVFTRPAPKSANAQVKFLLTRMTGSARSLAERLGTSTRTIERYRAGKLKKPQKRWTGSRPAASLSGSAREVCGSTPWRSASWSAGTCPPAC
ncbi:hypothetical protein [Streptomyces sp. NPDC058674]|uniref:hypothetical protein n=1 Tax=Streptomyces sp. NPDC058674 TaxID=3346592 RepID=UPI003664FB04